MCHRRCLDGKEKAHSMSIFFEAAATVRCGGGGEAVAEAEASSMMR